MIALKVEKIFNVAPNGKIYEEIRNPVGIGRILPPLLALSNCREPLIT